MKDKKEIMKLRKIIKISAIVAMSLSLSTLNAASNHIGYQGIAFDDGSALVEQNISLRFTVYQNNGSTVVYQETKTGIKTTDKGFFSHKIGSGVKSSSSPLWSNVAWNDNYKLKVEIDKNNGTSFVNLGTQDLISVAYAKKSEKATSATTLSGLTSSVAELNHVDGVSSNIQTQLDGKMKKGFTNNPPRDILVALVKTDGGLTYHLDVDSSELGYLNGVTSNIQSQLDDKLPSTGNASTATKLQTARTINGVSFDGSSNIAVNPYVKFENTTNSRKYISFVGGNTNGNKQLQTDGSLYYFPNTNTLTASVFSGSLSGNASSATTLSGLTSTIAELNKLDGYTGTKTELNYLDNLHATGVTSTEFDYLDGVTSSIQTQLNSKMANKTIYDQDNMSSNSATALATQQSIKAYVDSAVSGIDTSVLLPKSGGTLTGALKLNAGKFIEYSGDEDDYFGWYGQDKFRIFVNDEKYLATESGVLVVNDNGDVDDTSIDFRAESKDKKYMLFVDSSANRVGIGTDSLTHTFTVDGKAKITDDLYVTDYIGAGRLNIGGTTVTDVHDEDDMTSNSATALATQQSIKAYVDNAVSGIDTSSLLPKSGGTMTGRLLFDRQTYIGNDTEESTVDLFGWREDNQFRLYLNTFDIYLSTELGELVVNEGSKNNIDFRVESDTKNHMLFVDASANRFGIGKSSPEDNSPTLSYTLDVTGTVGVSGQITAGSINIGGTTVTDVHDEDNMSSNSASALATQQSIKKYVDTKVASVSSSGSYLPLSGGTITGDIGMGAGDYIRYSFDTSDYFGWSSNNIFRLNIDSKSFLKTNGSSLIVNEDGRNDVDFRVESDSQSNMLFVDASQNRIGIGTSNPLAPLHVAKTESTTLTGQRQYAYFNKFAGQLGNVSITSYPLANIISTTSIYAEGGIIGDTIAAISDKRIKKDIKPIKNSLETIKKLRPVHYKKKDEIENGSKRNYGFIAQELEKVLPEAVNTNKGVVPILKPFDKVQFEDGVIYTILVKNADDIKEQKYTTKDKRPDGEIIVKSKEVDDFKTVTYDMVFTVAVDAIQEQQEEIESLKSQLDAIKKALKSSGIAIK